MKTAHNVKKMKRHKKGCRRVAVLSITQADESLDTRENTDLTLKCRFTEQYDADDFTFYWARWTANPAQFENVAIGEVQLNSGYSLLLVNNSSAFQRMCSGY
ncbi:hypothetical protein GQX74_002122 [Glossina fuscipes]|nr:hypothetical protein GQX74_002122 [Glossina fuscipes]